VREQLKEYSKFEEAFERMVEHLEKNEIHLDVEQLTIGQGLRMDPASERFPGNAAANKLLTREYREPFVVPEHV
jgi:hypothetical protein